MSYVSSFVHAEPTAKLVAAEKATPTIDPTKAITKKETTTKIILFIAIVTCIVLAVNI